MTARALLCVSTTEVARTTSPYSLCMTERDCAWSPLTPPYLKVGAYGGA